MIYCVFSIFFLRVSLFCVLLLYIYIYFHFSIFCVCVSCRFCAHMSVCVAADDLANKVNVTCFLSY